ncbi:MAG: Lrp/AsnC family transcriptional regulator [Candidatus Micrarchaeia archaeon]|jgi:Lrp/AsnC family leucine-responsive transcriptional regulator
MVEKETGGPLKLDKKDKAIMQQLEENSRQSYSEIGRKVKLRSDTVEYRVNRLLESGLILRMFAEPDLDKLGLKTYRLYLKTETENPELETYLKNHPKAQWFAKFEGEWDYAIRYSLKNEGELKKEMDALSAMFGKSISAKNVVVATQQTYLPLKYLTGGWLVRSIAFDEVSNFIMLDETDRKIMEFLFENSRAKTVDMASKIKISADAVQYRIRKLLDNGIIKFFGVYYNPLVFGYTRHKLLFWLHNANLKREHELIAYCEQHQNSSYVNRIAGSWDLELDFDAKTPAELHGIIKDIRDKFSDIIRDYSVLTILDEHVPNPFRGSGKQ